MNKTIDLTIVPGHPGYHGECKVEYGPIGLDQLVQHRLIGSIKSGCLELGIDGTLRDSNARYDNIYADRDEVRFIDNRGGSKKETMPITKDMTTKASQQDSLITSLASPSHGIS